MGMWPANTGVKDCVQALGMVGDDLQPRQKLVALYSDVVHLKIQVDHIARCELHACVHTDTRMLLRLFLQAASMPIVHSDHSTLCSVPRLNVFVFVKYSRNCGHHYGSHVEVEVNYIGAEVHDGGDLIKSLRKFVDIVVFVDILAVEHDNALIIFILFLVDKA